MKTKLKASLLIPVLLLMVLALSACTKEEPQELEEEQIKSVSAQLAVNSKSYERVMTYPGTISAGTEATINAKATGSLAGLDIKSGDLISMGAELGRINDISSSNLNTGSELNSSQVKQAQLAVNQAKSAYDSSLSNYENTLKSSVKDLKQAEIARDQAASGADNLELTSEESLKSAQLAYETAQLAVEQARTNLENRTEQAQQSKEDLIESADLAVDSAISMIGRILVDIDSLADFGDDNNVSIDYASNLGALDSNSYARADIAYKQLEDAYSEYQKNKPELVSTRLSFTLNLVNLAQDLSEKLQYLFEKSIASAQLPKDSLTGISLSSLRQQASAFNTQINTMLSQLNSAKQALDNLELTNDNTTKSLSQALSIAKKQEASALQNLNNLKAGNSSQQDQANFSYSLAQNQYNNLKIKIEGQLDNLRTQINSAKLQYENSILTLESLYDSRLVISPIDGVVTRVYAQNGESVTPGQTILSVAQTGTKRVRFFVEGDSLSAMTIGKAVRVKDENNNYYDGIISSSSLQADQVTKRYQVEVDLVQDNDLLLGSIVEVLVVVEEKSEQDGVFILPLSTVNVGQNSSYIFIVDNGLAKQIPAEIVRVSGSLAYVKSQLLPGDLIIVEGNKMLSVGEKIEIKSNTQVQE